MRLKPGRARKHLLMVQQDVFLFQDTVADNICLGEDDLACEPGRMMDTLELVQARKLIDERGGLSFEVGERGRNLNQGETQLLAFARAAARQPTVLILDEATASVDSITEQKVQQAVHARLHRHSLRPEQPPRRTGCSPTTGSGASGSGSRCWTVTAAERSRTWGQHGASTRRAGGTEAGPRGT